MTGNLRILTEWPYDTIGSSATVSNPVILFYIGKFLRVVRRSSARPGDIIGISIRFSLTRRYVVCSY